MMREVEAKLAGMRKPQSFTVLSTDDGEHLVIQSDKSIGRFSFRTGEGVLNTKGSYFIHLSKVAGAKPYTFPAEFVQDCLEATGAKDGFTSLAGGAVCMAHTITEIGG
jgi:hypothetical protein